MVNVVSVTLCTVPVRRRDPAATRTVVPGISFCTAAQSPGVETPCATRETVLLPHTAAYAA